MTVTPPGHLVAAGRPRQPGAGLTRAGNVAYLALATAAARYLGRCEIVESVYARRSLAAGEIAFGRSDIDLGIRLYDACAAPGDGERLIPLRRRMHRLARALPIVGEAEVFAASELEDWVRLEPVREAFDRAAILLHGRPFRIPPWTIRRDDAAARFCFWFDRYLPAALAARHQRNLRKFALEMWATLAIIEGHFSEPPLSRQEMAAEWMRLQGRPALPHPRASAGELRDTIFELVRRAHAVLRPPLPRRSHRASFRLRLPPMLGWRTIDIDPLTARAAPRPAPAGGWMPVTPEAFDLYLHYVNPFAYDLLPAGVVDLGFERPPLERYLTALERWTHGHIARRPAFGSRSYGQGPRAIAYARHAARLLAAGAPPGAIDAEDLGELAIQDARRDAYFREWYAAAYAACAETRDLVRAVRARAGRTTPTA